MSAALAANEVTRMPPRLILDIFLNVCLPILAVMAFGWMLDRKFRLHLESLVKLNIYLMVPAFIFTRVVDTELKNSEALRIVAFTACVIGSMFVLSLLASRILRLDPAREQAMKLATMFYNSGNYGLPLVTLAFGHEGAAVQVYVLATMNVATFTVGLFLAHERGEQPRRHRHALASVLRQPTLYALVAGAFCRALDLHVQQVIWFWQPLYILQGCLIGFALVTLGVQMSQTKPAPFKAPLLAAIGLRLIASPLIAAGMCLLFGFSREASASLILAAGAPTAVNTALLAHEFGGDSSFAATSVYYTTLLSVITTTLNLALLRWWLG
jgi:malate permease and related proteins